MAKRDDDCVFFIGFNDAQNFNLMVNVIFCELWPCLKKEVVSDFCGIQAWLEFE
jgi:hypothetical protein